MIKAIIFDMDGVIIDTEKLHYEAYRKTLEDYDYTLSMEEYNLYFRSKGRRAGLSSIFKNINEQMILDIGKKKDKIYKDFIDKGEFTFFEDAQEVIEVCKLKNIPICIGTASSVGGYVAEKSGLNQYFDYIVTPKDVERSKPAPDIYIKCLELLNVNADEAIVIEDSPSGVEAALKAGIEVYYIKRPDAPELKVEGVKTLLDVRDLLTSM